MTFFTAHSGNILALRCKDVEPNKFQGNPITKSIPSRCSRLRGKEMHDLSRQRRVLKLARHSFSDGGLILCYNAYSLILKGNKNMFELPKLNYKYDALEPYLDAKTMEIHHTKHHQAYTDKLNTALESQESLLQKSIEDILKDLDSIPKGIRTAVINNGGGYYNHNLFWEIMGKDMASKPEGKLLDAINDAFESFELFKEKFTQLALTQFGSGWAWLVVQDNKLEIISTSNQDCPLSDGAHPILCLDVWEHAYYLKYQNKRPEYIENWFNVINWKKVQEIYEANTK